MTDIPKKYIVDEQNRKIAVQVDIETFTKIEEVLENYALYRLMAENEGDELLDLEKAKAHYETLKKAE